MDEGEKKNILKMNVIYHRVLKGKGKYEGKVKVEGTR